MTDGKQARAKKFPYLVNGALRKGRSNKKGVALNLTLRFGEDRFQFKVAGVTLVDVGIGIQSANLNWTLSDCQLPEGEWALDPTIEKEVIVERQISEGTHAASEVGQSRKSLAEVGAKLSATAPTTQSKANLERQSSSRSEQKKSRDIEDSFQQAIYTMVPRGTALMPSWYLVAPPGREMLLGTLLADQRFALAVPSGPNPQVQILLEVPPHGYVFRAQDGVLTKSPNKWGLTRILLKKNLLSKPIHIAELSFGPEE